MLNTLVTFAAKSAYTYSYPSSTASTAATAAGVAAVMGILMLPSLIVSVFMLIVMWKFFKKLGEPGWKCIIPIYNTVVKMQKVGMNPIWILGYCVPVLNLIIAIAMMIRIAQAFGKDTGFVIGLILLSPIFMAILAFGSATYDPSKINRNSFGFLNGNAPTGGAGAAPAGDANQGSQTDPWVNGNQA